MFAMYSNGMWSESHKLLASDRVAGDQFGWSVVVYDSIVVVGAFSDDNERGTNTGQ